MKNPAKDIRYVYLAVHNMLKHRGNFLYESFDISSNNNFIDLFKLLSEKIDEDGDLSSLVNFYKEYTKNDEKYQTPEMIWGYISSVLGYDYMFDDSTEERQKNRYLSELYDDADPIEEFVYRAAEWANNYTN